MTRPARRAAWAARPRAATVRAVAARGATGLLTTLVLVCSAPAGAAAPGTAGPVPPVPADRTVTPPTSDADDGEGPTSTEGVRILLDDVDPVVARVGEPLELRGRVVNDGERRRRLTSLTVSSTWVPLASRGAVTDWLEATDPALIAGRVLGDDAIGPVVAPGREIPFTVRVPQEALLGAVWDRGVLGLQLRAEDVGSDGASAPENLVSLRTVLSVTATEEAPQVPLALAWVVPLTVPPDPALTSPDPGVRNPAWYAATGPGSPARTWLDGLDLPGVTWMVDPALLRVLSPAETLTGPGEDAEDEDDPPVDAEGEDDPPVDAPQESGDGPAGDDGASTAAPGGTTATAVPAPAPTDDGEGGPNGDDPGVGDGGETETEEPDAADVDDGVVELRGLLARVDGPRLWWLPTDDPDLTTLAGLEVDDRVVQELVTRSPAGPPAQLARLLRRGTPTVAWPVAGAPSAQDVTTLAGWWSTRRDPDGSPGSAARTPPGEGGPGLEGVVVPRESLTGSSAAPVGSAAVPLVEVPGVTALGADSRLAGLLADARADTEQIGGAAVTQRLLADTLTAHQEAPAVARSILVAPPRGTVLSPDLLEQVAEGFASATWVEPVAAADLLARAGTQPAVPLTGVAPQESVLGGLTAYLEPQPTPVDARRARSLGRIEDELEGLSEVLTDTDAVRSWEPVLPGLWSARWRGAPDPWSHTWRGLRSLSAETRAGVHANPSTINFLSDQGLMQVTVVNDLPVPVRDVQARLVPDRALLQVVDQPGPVSVGARSRATVSFSARAVARGQTRITAELTTPNGTVLGDDAVVEVRVQPTGSWIYWVLGGLAGLLLLLGTFRALRGGARPDGRPARATTPTPPKEQHP